MVDGSVRFTSERLCYFCLLLTNVRNNRSTLCQELTLYTVPANYVIQSEAKMIALRSTMNHYNAMAVGRRK
jgi:hypothetical protein